MLTQEIMAARSNSALIVGYEAQPAIALAKWLEARGWRSHCELSAGEAFRLLGEVPFDLILSSMKMEPELRLRLVTASLEAGSSLFFSLAVEYGCWWLPTVRMGEHSIRPAAFQSSELADNILLLAADLDWKRRPSISGSMAAKVGFQNGQTAKARSGQRVQSLPEPENMAAHRATKSF
jgi:hypothetical protein